MSEYIGMQLGPYKVLEQIGRGGMAAIFKAYQPSMDRYVAIKILPRHLTEDKTFVARFTQEAHTLAHLEHPHILPVHDYGEQDGVTYLVMRYIHAGTLKDAITRRGPMDVREAARLMDQVGRALGYAHSRGVVHRDIKPSNVLIDERGDAFLTDFGIAKLVEGAAQFTASGAIIGTPAYMSPEQGMGEPADARSDIYSLGVMLYEMVTGRLPYEAETPLAVLLKHASAELPPPRQMRPDLPAEVERVILKAMARLPQDRFQTAEEMVDALQQAIADLSTQALAPKPAEKTLARPPAKPAAATVVAAPPPPAAPAAAPRSASPLPWLAAAAGGAAVCLVVALVAALAILPRMGGEKAQVTPTSHMVVAQATSIATATAAPLAAGPTAGTEPAATRAAAISGPGPRPNGPVILEDDFSGGADGARALFGKDKMIFEYVDGVGRLTARESKGILPAMYSKPQAADFYAEFSFQAPEAAPGSIYGLIFRSEDGQDAQLDEYYALGLYPSEQQASLLCWKSGAWRVQQYFDLHAGLISPTEFNHVRLEAVGDQFRVFINHAFVFEYTDTALRNAGWFGLFISRGGDQDETVYFDDLRIYAAGPETPPGWTNYTNANFVLALARQDNYLWAGGSGGLVRWNLKDGGYVKITMADGLASNHVNDLLADGEALWVATDAGISRFDGQAWQTFADSLDSTWVNTLWLDDQGAIWAGTEYGERGLNYYDGSAWGAPPVPPLPFEYPSVQALAMDQSGRLFTGLLDDGLAFLEGGAWRALSSANGLPGDHVYDILPLDDGQMLISFGYGVIQFDPETAEWENLEQLAHTMVYRMRQARDGAVWFAGEDGAARYDPQTGDWQAFEAGPGAFPADTATDIVQAETDLWFGSYGSGAVLYDGKRWTPWQTPETLGSNSIAALLRDGTGAMWAAHDDGSGLSRYDAATDTWQTFGDDEGAFDWPSWPGVDNKGRVWIGGYGELRWYDGQTWQTFTAPQLADRSVERVIWAGDVQWIWTFDSILRHDPASDAWITFTITDHPELERANAYYVDDEGALWVGGANGLVYYDGSAWARPEASGSPPSYVTGLAGAPDGSLWVAADSLLYRLADNKWTRPRLPGGADIYQLAIGPDGIVWVGGEGLGRLDPARNSWQLYTPADGLVNRWVTALCVTPEGVVWIGTRGGVSRYVPGE